MAEKWTLLDSTNLAAVRYDAAGRMLWVRFRAGGRVYVYSGVPPEKHAALLAAPSVGRFFHREIRFKHPYREEKKGDGGTS